MKRWGVLIGVLLCWPLLWDYGDTAFAQCVVQSGTNTYTSGSFLSASECDTNGKLKTSGGAGGTQYDEDTAHNSGDTGTLSLGVRRDANTTLADTTGDYAPLQLDANGNLKVNIIAGAGSGGTAMTDDAAFTPGTTSVTPIAGTFDDTTPDSVDEGDGGAVRMSANRNLYTTLRDAAGNERGANINASNELLTSSNTELPAAAALADNTANPTVPGVAAFLMCYDGSTWDRCQGGLTDTDDNGIAYSQVPGLVVNIPYVANGTTWERQRKFVYLEDAAHADGDGLAMMGTVRRDTAASSTITDGDNATLNTDATGRLWTHVGAVDGNVTVTATNLDVQSGGADLATEATLLNTLTSANFAAAFGTAGTADTQVMSVQGIASMTPILANPGTATQWGVRNEDTAHGDADPLIIAGVRRIDTAASSTATSGDYGTLNHDALGLLWTRQLDPCSGVAKVYYPVNISTAATTEIVNGAGASTHVYICSIILHTDAANDVAFVEDDTDACASPAAGIMGGTTTGAGFQLAASTGLAMGNGQGSIARTANTNYYVCLITSAATQLTGVITYALAP